MEKSHIHHLHDNLPAPSTRLHHPEWITRTVLIIPLCWLSWQQPSRKTGMTEVTTCKQQREEPLDDFIHRLTLLYNTHSGLTQPPTLRDVPSTWEIHPCNHIQNGLQKDIAAPTSDVLTCADTVCAAAEKRQEQRGFSQGGARREGCQGHRIPLWKTWTLLTWMLL